MTLYSHKILGRTERKIPKRLKNIAVQVLYLRALKDATQHIGLCVDYVNFPAESIKISWRRVIFFFLPNPHKSGVWMNNDPVVMSQKASLN